MWVVKLGGSLESGACLRDWLSLLAEEGAGRVVVVPGGGRYADAVRVAQKEQRFSDPAAHRMALQAMEQYAAVLVSMEPRLRPTAREGEIRRALSSGVTPVWLPIQMAGNDPDIPEDWTVTSDSLALWLARRLGAEALVLVKSIAAPGDAADVEALSAAGYLDRAFPDFLNGYRGAVACLAQDETETLRTWLGGSKWRGPVMGPRRNKKARHPEEAGGAGQ